MSGTKGYAYIPAPWWKTSYFELRYEDLNQTRKYFYKFEGDGLRYEINDFLASVNKLPVRCIGLSEEESIAISQIIEKFRNKENVQLI